MSHVFISYVRDNQKDVDRLCAELQQRGIKVWLDREQIKPGERWQQVIRHAIEQGAYFLACFSRESTARESTYMNEELVLAIEELRKRPTNRAWFISVRLSDCAVPDRDIGAGETLKHLQWVDLWNEWSDGVRRIIATVNPSTKQEEATSPLQGLADARARALSMKIDLSEQAIFILRQLVESNHQQFAYDNLGEGRYCLQFIDGEQEVMMATDPRFIQDDLHQLVGLQLLTIEYNASGTGLYGITRNAVRFMEAVGGKHPS